MQSVQKLRGGWNSTTWLVQVTVGDKPAQCVAKLADSEDGDAFRCGLRVASAAASGGFPSGAPVLTADGRLVVELPEGVLALLEYVPGRSPSTASVDDMRRAGGILARAHLAVGASGTRVDEQHAWPWPWADGCLQNLPLASEIHDAAARALDEAREVTARVSPRMGVVHGDPGMDAFRLRDEAPQEDGLIDWAAAMEAPFLYDLASFAVVTRTNPESLAPWLEGYRRGASEVSGELPHMGVFVRLRWVCHAIYFASRLERGIVRGAASEAENRERLADAYRGLTERVGPTLPPL
ncbi:phosphotransferase enzyme family protein [Streptomyces monomycini]|uniref:phosphotransferase enzyme family protein n=1 Tax=Streptomyces monomycini TaxID=371720 RepID=UPI0012FF0F1B|nr:phosphotransferase [Streptomyces monomycini]